MFLKGEPVDPADIPRLLKEEQDNANTLEINPVTGRPMRAHYGHHIAELIILSDSQSLAVREMTFEYWREILKNQTIVHINGYRWRATLYQLRLVEAPRMKGAEPLFELKVQFARVVA